jgi:hypothetical protein
MAALGRAQTEEVQCTGNVITCRTREPATALRDLTALLVASRIALLELQVRKATLEDVFIGLTRAAPENSEASSSAPSGRSHDGFAGSGATP